MAENTNILEINGLHKNFFIRGQKFEVLAGVDLTVKKGELLAIVGASGCGKSTLLKLITTLETISSGEILLDGEPVNGPSPKCSMIFQEARLFPWLTVEQNIEFVISDTAFTRMAMQQEVLRIWEQDKTTMMIVTHDIDEAIYLSNRVVIMGKNPGVVKKIVPVNLPFPRDRTDSAFLEIRGEIMKEFLDT